MNILKLGCITLTLTLLSACSLTPAEKAEQAKENAEKLFNTQVSLAQQCDPQTALLMQQLPTINNLSAGDQAAFKKKYNAKINNSTFQACYRMAWQSYKEQNQLEIARMQEWNDQNELNWQWDWDNGYFVNQPFGYWQ